MWQNADYRPHQSQNKSLSHSEQIKTGPELLKEKNLVIGDRVEIEVTAFEAMNDKGPNRFWGSAFGHMKTAKTINTIYHNCPAEFYEAIMEGRDDYVITGKIVSAFMRPCFNSNNSGNEMHVTINTVEAIALTDDKSYKIIPKERGSGASGEFMQIIALSKESTVKIKTESGSFLELVASRWAQISVDGCCVCTSVLQADNTIIDSDNDFWCDTCANTNDFWCDTGSNTSELDKTAVSNIIQMAMVKGKLN
jgi:hypothetical protein